MSALRQSARLTSALAFGLLLSACGGGGGGHTLPGVLPAAGTAAPATTGGHGSASFTITVPAATTTASIRRTQYVSAQTASVQIDVRQSGTEVSGFPVTLGVTPGSPNCAATSGGTTCALSINILAGTYSVGITALDAGGHAISAAVAVPLTIAAGALTNVPLTLNGVLAALTVTPAASNAPTFVSGSASAGFGLIGQGPRSFTISATDVNGNTIVGPGTPSFSVAATGPLAMSVVQPTTSAPNTFTLAPPQVWASGSDRVSVGVSYADGTPCATTGSVCSASVNVAMRELLVVRDASGVSLTLYPEGDTTPIGTITQGINGPSPVWWTPNGDIISGNNRNLTVYSFPYQSAPYATLTTSTNSTNAIVWTAEVDPSGNLLVTDFFGSTIRVYAPPFVTPAAAPSTPTVSITDGLAYPGAFAIDHQGNVFAGNGNGGNGNDVTEYAAKTFAKIATITPPFTTTTGFCCVTVATSASGKLAVSSAQEPTVWVYDPPYTGAPSATIAAGSNSGLSFDANNNLFVATATGAEIYAPPYTGAATTVTPATPVSGCETDDAGTVICMQPGGGEMDFFAKPFSSTPTQRVTSGIQSSSGPIVVP